MQASDSSESSTSSSLDDMDSVASLGDMEALGCDEDQCVEHGEEEEVNAAGDAASPTLDTPSMQSEKVCVYLSVFLL